ncbi:MAG: response regulator [Acidobacteriota bacterium]
MAHVLVVEDDKTTAKSLTAFLRREGHEVTIAPDALTGVSLAVKHRPDVLLLDLVLPGGGGLSVMKRIDDLAVTTGTPIIVMTASPDPELEAEARTQGAAAFLHKPFRPEDLTAALAQALATPMSFG